MRTLVAAVICLSGCGRTLIYEQAREGADAGCRPAAEKCNGADDDCDGLVDEDDPGGGAGCGGDPSCPHLKHCVNGVLRCVGGDELPEVCNGRDDDCDGAVDERDPQGGGVCATTRPGPCGAGVYQCRAGALRCIETVQPSPEICGNGVDEDCSGAADDGCGGCADGQAEAFADLGRYPRIAGCAGGFTTPGLLPDQPASCGRGAGDDSANPRGLGCTAEDLCATGWHVCVNEAEVRERSIDGCAGAASVPMAFFATRQSGPGCGICATGTSTDPQQCTGSTCRAGCAQTPALSNDIFGCGTVGRLPVAETCGVLDRFGFDACSALPRPWTCGPADSTVEAVLVVKPGPEAGGVLCCR